MLQPALAHTGPIEVALCRMNPQSKAEFKNLDDSEVLSSEFSGLRISAVAKTSTVSTTLVASMTSTASTTSVASMTLTASFHQKKYWSLWLDYPWHQNDQYWSLFIEYIIKNPIFYLYLISFLFKAVEASLCYFFENWLQIPKCHNLRHSKNTLYL